MTENSPRRQADGVPSATDAAWDIPAVAEALNATPETRHDPTHGEAVVFALGDHQPVELELFPGQHMVRITSEAAGVQLTLFRQERPRILQAAVVFPLPGKPDGRNFSVSAVGEVQLVMDKRPVHVSSPARQKNGE